MANKSKQIGTRAETIVVSVAKRNGFPYARRNTLSGALDKGDVHLGDGTDTIVEVKGGAQCKALTPAKMLKWMTETRIEIKNSGSSYGFLVTQRSGYGEKSAEAWFAHVPVEYTNVDPETCDYVTTDLGTVLELIREKLDNGS